MDALELLLRITEDSKQKELRMQALRCLQDILSVNPMNAVDIKHIGAPARLIQIISNLSTDLDVLNAITDILNYMAVILSKHDQDILHHYISHLSNDLPAKATITVVSSVVKLISDSLYHSSPLPNSLIASFTGHLRKFISLPTTNSMELQPTELSNQNMLDDTSRIILLLLHALALVLKGNVLLYI